MTENTADNAPDCTIDPRDLPRISIVVPSFRTVDTIERTLRSLIDQNYPNLEIIVMDGASDDGAVDVIRSFDSQLSYWESKPDEGQVDALNKGFRRATGEIWGWLCADDEMAPGTLARIAAEFIAHPGVDVVTGGCLRVFGEGREVATVPGPDFDRRLFFMNTIEQPSTFWRSAAHKAVGELDGAYRYAFDWEFWCRLKRAGFTWRAIDDQLSIYYFSSTNLTSTGGRKIVREMYRVIREYGPKFGALALAYYGLYLGFDLRGFYDAETRDELRARHRTLFWGTLSILYVIFGREPINCYNWNFASRQERALGWA